MKIEFYFHGNDLTTGIMITLNFVILNIYKILRAY